MQQDVFRLCRSPIAEGYYTMVTRGCFLLSVVPKWSRRRAVFYGPKVNRTFSAFLLAVSRVPGIDPEMIEEILEQFTAADTRTGIRLAAAGIPTVFPAIVLEASRTHRYPSTSPELNEAVSILIR